MDPGSNTKRRNRRRYNGKRKIAEKQHAPKTADTIFDEGYQKCLEELKLTAVFNHSSSVPISFKGLPKIIVSVFTFLNCKVGLHWSGIPESQLLIVWTKCLLWLAERKMALASQQIFSVEGPAGWCSWWLPYPVALYLQAIGTFDIDGQKVFPCLIKHRIELASGALNYSISGLTMLIEECSVYRSRDDELVRVAQEMIDLPGFHWEENDTDNTVRIHPDTIAAYCPVSPSTSDWELFGRTCLDIQNKLKFGKFHQQMRGYCQLFRLRGAIDDVWLRGGSPVQAVRFPESSDADGRIRYYVNSHVPAYIEKLAPALMLGYEYGGVAQAPLSSGIKHCYKEGIGNCLDALNAVVWAHNPEYETSPEFPIKNYEVPLRLTSVEALSKISGIIATRIPISFRALPYLVDRVWQHMQLWVMRLHRFDKTEFESKKLLLLKSALFAAEVKLAHAQIGAPTMSSDQNIGAVQSFLSGERDGYTSTYFELPYPIAMYIDHIGRFSVQNQIVVPQLIEHDIKEASGAINYSLTGLVTLMKACSEFGTVETGITKIAWENISNLPGVEWEIDPMDSNKKRISAATILRWSVPSYSEYRESFPGYNTIKESNFFQQVDLTSCQGSSAQAVRFPGSFNYGSFDGERFYMNVTVEDKNVKLATAFMFGYEHNGKLFSRFCGGFDRCLRSHWSYSWETVQKILDMNRNNRKYVCDYSSSD